MNNTNNPLFFIHIPKTAGSSFRKAGEAFFGHENTFYDYETQSVETHPKILEYVYEKNDPFTAGNYITKHARLLSGHVHYVKYAPFFHPKNVITFVRSPEQRVRSHFEHYVRHKKYNGTFESFIEDNRFTNVQSRILNGLGIQGFGFVGLTEEYETSIALINALYNTNINPLNLNRNEKKDKPFYSFNSKEFDLIHQYNKDDFELYQQSRIRFQRQKKAIEESRPFIRFGLLPVPPKQAQHKISGWLTCYESDKAQALSIFINGNKSETIIANEYRNIANERNMNRKGFIGFSYHLPKSLKNNDLIEFYSEKNNELLYSMRYYKSN